MTIGNYIKAKFNLWSVELSDDFIALELARVNFDSASEMDSASNVDEFFYNVIPDLILMPSNVSEGGFSLSYDKNAMTSYYKMLCTKLGKPNLLSQNTIKDITSKW